MTPPPNTSAADGQKQTIMLPTDTSIFNDQINSLGDRMDAGFTEIKDMLHAFDYRLRAIEKMEAGCQPVVTMRIDSILRNIADHETRLATKSQQINKLETQLSRLAVMYNAFIFIGGTMGVSIIALIWALITGQAQVVFK